MDIVIDIECFYNNVVKELGFCNGTISKNFSFQPPYPYEFCTKKEKRVNSWCTRKFHFIGWNSGSYSYGELPAVIKSLSFPNAKYYAKGLQKCQLLEKLFQKPFINLEELGCPKISELVCDNVMCPSYTDRHKLTTRCAYKKAVTFYTWLHNFQNIFTFVNE